MFYGASTPVLFYENTPVFSPMDTPVSTSDADSSACTRPGQSPGSTSTVDSTCEWVGWTVALRVNRTEERPGSTGQDGG